MEFVLRLDEPSLQFIVNALAEKPYREVANIVGNIMEQVRQQQQAANPPE